MKPKVIVFNKNTPKGQFNTYGYGKLTEILKCEITEELNGRYDLELTIGMDDPKAKYILKWNILSVDGQLFRIEDIFKNNKLNTMKIYAKHIFYDIQFGFIEDARAESVPMAQAMEIGIPEDFKGIFEVNSDIEDVNTLYFVKNYGVQNMFEIMNRWQQGELIRDNFNIAINKAKGSDKGVTFTYKKVDAIEVTEASGDVVTRLYPTGNEGVSLQEKYIYIPNWNEDDYLPFHITKEVKFNADNEGDLRILAQKEAEKIGLSKVNFAIKVNDLEDTTFYGTKGNLMNVQTGDIVTVKHPKLNVRVKIKCIKRVHEKVENYVNLEFGQPLDNLFKNIDNTNVTVAMPDVSNLKNELFYHFNGMNLVVTNGGKDKQLASMKLATSATTNLMIHLSMNPFTEVEGVLKLRILVNNKEVQFSPIINLPKGYSMQTISFPLIAFEGGFVQVCRIWGTFESEVAGATCLIETNRLHFSVMGQNVAMGLIKVEPFTGAYIEYSLRNSGLSVTGKSASIKLNRNSIITHDIKCNKTLICNPNKNITVKIPKSFKLGGIECLQ